MVGEDLDRRLSPQGLDPPKPFQQFILTRSTTAPLDNMVLIFTSIKSNEMAVLCGMPTVQYSVKKPF